MAYFNHAFTKIFLGTQTSAVNPNINLVDGFIITPGIPTVALANTVGLPNTIYGPGSYGFFDPTTWTSVDAGFFSSNGCCPLILASASLLARDKVGPFHGGYQESNKSKMINPKYLQKVYKVETCVPQQSIISIGHTPGTTGNIVATVAPFVAGTETYVDGSYTNIILTGGTGSGALANVTVLGGVVTAVTIVNGGINYTPGDVLTLSSAAIATAGSLTELVAGTSTTATVATVSQPNPLDFQSGTLQADCQIQFLCGETYYLRLDVKGSPTLRALNHNAYQNLSAYTGCCVGPVPTKVDGTYVYLQWAKAMIINNYVKDFVAPVVFDYTGVAWYAPGTTVTMDGTNTPVTPAQWWTSAAGVDQYATSAQALAWTSLLPNAFNSGMRVYGAYVETKFGNCSFQITDFFEKEPVRIYASLVDLKGDPCTCDKLCIYNDCRGKQGMGFGEQVVRDLILSESYLQNYFSTDIRIREINQGDQILNSLSRNALYTRYFILHSVPRFNNPSGTFDNDRYMNEIIVSEANPLVPIGNPALEAFLIAWLDACPNCVSLEVESCTHCAVVPD